MAQKPSLLDLTSSDAYISGTVMECIDWIVWQEIANWYPKFDHRGTLDVMTIEQVQPFMKCRRDQITAEQFLASESLN